MAKRSIPGLREWVRRTSLARSRSRSLQAPPKGKALPNDLMAEIHNRLLYKLLMSCARNSARIRVGLPKMATKLYDKKSRAAEIFTLSERGHYERKAFQTVEESAVYFSEMLGPFFKNRTMRIVALIGTSRLAYKLHNDMLKLTELHQALEDKVSRMIQEQELIVIQQQSKIKDLMSEQEEQQSQIKDLISGQEQMKKILASPWLFITNFFRFESSAEEQ